MGSIKGQVILVKHVFKHKAFAFGYEQYSQLFLAGLRIYEVSTGVSYRIGELD
jgi:hypothetical protein